MNAGRITVVLWGLLALAPLASAQTGETGSIAGVARDTSGAVLPGVTVEAASPALIEKVRTAVTDGRGVYRIVDLRPGAYTVTFTLPGFSTLRREGINLAAGFTATVNAELGLGGLQETITVSGEAPVVDTRSVRQQQTVTRELLVALPTPATQGVYATFLPAAVVRGGRHDVGGLQGERTAQFALHGQPIGDIQLSREGMNLSVAANVHQSYNPHAAAEIVVEIGGISADSSGPGVRTSIVPRDGGNVFSGSFNSLYAPADWQAGNLTDELRARGLTATPSLKRFYDVGGGVGGPIRQDSLWFMTAYRDWESARFIPGVFFNRLQGTFPPLYEPDLTRPAVSTGVYRDLTTRLSWQASAKDNVALAYSLQNNCQCPQADMALDNVTPEGTANHHYNQSWQGTVNWRRPATSRLLLEASTGVVTMAIHAKPEKPLGPNDLPAIELSTGLQYGARAFSGPGNTGGYGVTNRSEKFAERFAMSYVTGSHSFKTGLDVSRFILGHKNQANPNQYPGSATFSFRNGVPESVRIWATPFGRAEESTFVGVYAQDQWTVRKLTLNLGARFDYANGAAPAQHLAAGRFVPARDLPAVENSPNWKNLSPRLGIAYDVFGDGRTALKGTLGRYPTGASGSNTVTINEPMRNQASSATRTWNDANRNFVPDCVLGPSVPEANGECGPLSDRSFGQVRGGSTRFADDVLSGFNDSQPYNWQGSVSIQREFRPGIGIDVGYFRTWYGNFTTTDNLAVTPADFDGYCITAPVDSRLPGGGGQEMCGLSDIRPASFGQVDNLVTLASNFGKRTEVYNGVDATLNARFGQGAQFSGGLSVGRTVTDNCFVVDSPQQARPGFCRVVPPWSNVTQVKFLVVYPLPWNFQTSAVYQNIPGIPITASYVARNAEIAPSLGRNLGRCRGAAVCNATEVIDLIPPNTVFEDRLQQVDFRVSRIFRAGNVRLEGTFDVYNLFNENNVLRATTRFGPRWLNAQEIVNARFVKIGAKLDF